MYDVPGNWKRLTVRAIVSLIAATALSVWGSSDHVESTAAVAKRTLEPRPGGLPAAEPEHIRAPRTAGISDGAEPRRQPAARTVSEQQARIIADVLRGFPLDQRPLAEPIAVLALDGDVEAAEYAKQLARVLEEGGWAATIATTTVRYIGVMCLVDNTGQFPIHARVLTFAFERAGISCIAANKGKAPSNRIEIVVGQNPSDPP